jgi:hypothetical protein
MGRGLLGEVVAQQPTVLPRNAGETLLLFGEAGAADGDPITGPATRGPLVRR